MKKGRGRPKGYKMSTASKLLCSSSHEFRTNYYTRKVSVDGIVYNSVTEAAEAFGVSKASVVYRIKNIRNSVAFKGWTYL